MIEHLIKVSFNVLAWLINKRLFSFILSDQGITNQFVLKPCCSIPSTRHPFRWEFGVVSHTSSSCNRSLGIEFSCDLLEPFVFCLHVDTYSHVSIFSVLFILLLCQNNYPICRHCPYVQRLLSLPWYGHVFTYPVIDACQSGERSFK